MSSPKILLTGATGYIGGSVLAQILKSDSPAITSNPISCLVRGEDRAKKLSSKFGNRVNPIVFKDLDDTDAIIAAVSQHDVVVNTTQGWHPTSGKAYVLGLAERKKQTGKDVFMIHTSGTSNMADQPITKAYADEGGIRTFTDSTDDIYSYEHKRNATTPYPQRSAESSVIDTGLETGVKTIVIMSPLIFGEGSGEFNRFTMQVPGFVKATSASGQAFQIGDGKGIWDHVHVADLAVSYELVSSRIVEQGGKGVPFGKKGIIFSENGRHSWGEVAEEVAKEAYAQGKISTPKVKSIGLEEGANAMLGGNTQMMESGFASNSSTKGVVAREEFGWKPTRGEEAWKAHFAKEVQLLSQ